MKYSAILRWLIPAIGLLAMIAAGIGVFYETPGQPYPFTSHRGEVVQINGHGLYFYDTVSSAAQQQANDAVTLFLGLPLLIVSALWAFRGSLRGQLLLTGTLGFFLYTYLSMSMLTAFNPLFLVYVALFTLSLFAFITAMLSFDLKTLPSHFTDQLPRRWIAGLMVFVAAFLSMAWLGRIAQSLAPGAVPALENGTTMVIQAMDLGLIMPLAVLTATLLLRRAALGYLLAAVFTLKAITMGIAISVMAINMARVGVPENLGIAVPFFAITLINLVLAYAVLASVREGRPAKTVRPSF